MASVNQNWTSSRTSTLRAIMQRKYKQSFRMQTSATCSRAVELRKQEDTLTCSVDTAKFTSGACNVVAALTFSDSTQWVARIMLPQENEEGDISTSLLSEISTTELIRTQTTIPIPHVFGYGVSKTDHFGYPYLLMEALPGKVLDRQMACSIPEKHQRNFAAQLARYIYELSTIRFSQIGRVLHSELAPFSVMGSPSGRSFTHLTGIFLPLAPRSNKCDSPRASRRTGVGGGCLVT